MRYGHILSKAFQNNLCTCAFNSRSDVAAEIFADFSA